MPRALHGPVVLPQKMARLIWLRAQGLDQPAPFGDGFAATPIAVAHLGYIQIDTIAVIERCHHHILWTRNPEYRRVHLQPRAKCRQAGLRILDSHALAYVPRGRFPLLPARG